MKDKFSGGYIGILVILIGTVIVVFLMAQQYERIAARDKQISTGSDADNEGADATSAPIMPIDKALNIKAKLEARDRSMLDQ
jgi:hypothetical protein